MKVCLSLFDSTLDGDAKMGLSLLLSEEDHYPVCNSLMC